jgi:O-antigen ligase
MELGLGLGLGFLLARESDWQARLGGGFLSLVGILGVVLSKSRGGGLTVLVMLLAVLVWGFSQWPVETRWWNRLSATCLLVILLLLAVQVESGYVKRFRSYFIAEQERGRPLAEQVDAVWRRLKLTCRGRMYGGAVRAWQTAKWTGIGPGMHRNRWPDFAATTDGNREEGVWPSQTNHNFFSYEVHSDWLQLLEELGIIGVALFLVPCVVVTSSLLAGVRREIRRWNRLRNRRVKGGYYPYLLGSLLGVLAMGFHSWGDFNLQMPATTWMLAAIVAVGLAEAKASRTAVKQRSHR